MTIDKHSVAENLAFFNSELFKTVQLSGIFNDSKTFADAVPKAAYKDIYQAFVEQNKKTEFDLKQFVLNYFSIPTEKEIICQSAQSHVSDQIKELWQILHKPADDNKSVGSLLPLKHPYIIPGGRFREIYYWDSYFTALGLMVDKKYDIVISMLENFIDLQQQFGLIPNGNRTYYLSRSQPPILTLLVDLVFSTKEYQNATSAYSFLNVKDDFFKIAVKSIENEYNFWMDGVEQLTPSNPTNKRVVLLEDGSVLNRYWDDIAEPRPESYREDFELSSILPKHKRAEFYRNIRAACESGWDFCSRWLKNEHDLLTIQTTNIIPIDLNCLLFHLEKKLAYYYLILDLPKQSQQYQLASHRRKLAINKYLWSEQLGFYFDYNFEQQKQSKVYSLAASVAIFTQLATSEQSQSISEIIKNDFLQQGGIVTTLTQSSQQWDYPNGWAPLHWFTVQGLLNYHQNELAFTVMKRWLKNVENFYFREGKLMEKYDVCQRCGIAEGGEYDVQEGFGWTNGVSQAFYQMLKIKGIS
jgi:alpha,alpha-trehalase